MFDLAVDLEDTVFSLRESLEAIENTLLSLTDLAPDPDEEYSDEEEDQLGATYQSLRYECQQAYY